MQWDISTCSDIFDRLARRIFHERRQSPASWLFRSLFGRRSLFGEIHKWILWLLHDSCYDARIFDTTLREVFGDDRHIFDNVCPSSSSQLSSKSKVAVVATSIAKEIKSFVFGNFNAANLSDRNQGQLL
jgi:hypothetical protein